ISQSGASDKTWGRRPVRWQPVVWPIRLILLAISRLGGEMLLLSSARATSSALLTIGTKQTYRGEFAHVRFLSEADKPRASGARRSDKNRPCRTSFNFSMGAFKVGPPSYRCAEGLQWQVSSSTKPTSRSLAQAAPVWRPASRPAMQERALSPWRRAPNPAVRPSSPEVAVWSSDRH